MDGGVLVHRYGPHGFHTANQEVWEFVNRFADFHPVVLRVEGRTSLGIISLPFNDVSASLAGDLAPEQIRDLVFRDYSEKHWGIPWEDIPHSITSRLPERRRSSDCRYHLDPWQGVPREGYTRMFERMFEGVPVHLGCSADAWRNRSFGHVVYTGSIDEYFRRPRPPGIPQPGLRISRGRPALPLPFGGNTERYQLYRGLAATEKHVTFTGRLATYKYLDMDDVIAQTMVKLAPLVGSRRPLADGITS